MSVKVRFNGAAELTAALKRNMKEKAVKRIVRQNGAELQARAQKNAPVDTGTLKRSIGLEISDGGLTATVAPGTEYAEYVEFGTRYMNAQPYVKPAFNVQKEIFKRDLNNLMK